MNKLFTKVATLCVGLAMATGVGVAVSAGRKDVSPAQADAATMAPGTNGSECTVNGNDGIKVGTSKKGGDMTITVGSGATSLSFYAAAWNGVSGLSLNLTMTVGSATTTSFALTADSGVSNNSPFTLSGTESSYLFTTDLSNVTSESVITLESSIAKRFVVWNATYEADSKTLSSISVSGYTTSFTVGDTFSFGGTVTAHYSDSTSANVTRSATFSGYNMSTAGNYTVTASYTEGAVTKTATYGITVSVPSKTLSSIAITTPPTKTSYEAGELFDSAGMVVTATFSDASTDPVTSSCTFSPSGALTTSDDQITVSYTYAGTTKTATQAITVTAASSITLDPTVTTTFPYQGITLSVSNGVLDNGTDYRVYKGATITVTSTVGDIASISLTYVSTSYDGGGWASSYSPNASTWTSPAATSGSSGEQARITLIVIKLASSDPVQSLSITGSMTKTTYNQNEAWDPTGFTVNAYYESAPSTPVDVTSEVQWSYSPETTASTSTTSVVATASFGGQTANSSAQSVTINAASYTNTTNLTPGNYYIKYVESDTPHYMTSVSGGTGATQTSKTNALVFTFSLVGNDTWQIINETNYLSIGASSTSLSLESTVVTCSIAWDDENSGTRKIGGGSDGRFLAWYASNSEFRTYKSGTLAVTLESAKTVAGFSVYTVGANKNVLKGSTFDASAAAAAGFQARLNYTDSTYDDVTSAATWTLDTATSGTKTLTVSYLTYTDSSVDDMVVYAAVIKTLSVDSSGAKTTYVEGEQLNTADLVIKGYEQDSTEHTLSISDCSFSPANGDILSTSDTSVTVTYTNEDTSTATTTYSITVSAFVGYTKITSTADLVVGESYVLGVENNNHIDDLMGDAKDESATAFRNRVDAASAFNASHTTVTQSGASTAGAVVVTLLSDGSGMFAFYSITDDKYLAGTASGGYFINKSSLSDAGDFAWWTIAFADGLMSVTLKDSTRVLGYNLGSPRFATYASYANNSTTATNGTAHPVLFKMAGSSVKTAVTSFANTSLKMNDPAYEGDITTSNCASNYSAMKTAYTALSDAQKNVFQYSEDYSAARARLNNWAKANGETFTYGSETPFAAGKLNTLSVVSNNGTGVAIIVVTSMIGLSALGGFFFLRKRKEI